MLFETDNFFKDIDLNFVSVIDSQKSSIYEGPELYDVNEGFLRGNMFKDLYLPYKNYMPCTPTLENEKEKALFNVSKYDFAINELNLYLDFHPDDEKMFLKFKEFVCCYLKSKREYEEKYGPLWVVDDLSNKYTWSKDPWPWQKEDYHV